jgi:hypothetical protein
VNGKGKISSSSNDSGLNFEVQLGIATEQALPASHLIGTEHDDAGPEGLCLGRTCLKYIIRSGCSGGVSPSSERAVTDRRYTKTKKYLRVHETVELALVQTTGHLLNFA